jgi:hypothetical protein
VSAPVGVGLYEVEPEEETWRVTPFPPPEAPAAGTMATLAATIDAASAKIGRPSLR